MAYKISEDTCTACGTCIDECPVGAISAGDVYVIDFDKCKLTDLNRQDKDAMLARLLRSFNKEVRITDNAAHFKESDFALLKEAALAG